jgi:hypothetical protein
MAEGRSLPAGTEVFHGTSQKGFLIPRGPAFFSDTYSVAKYFTTWHQGKKKRILRFEVTDEIPKLALIESKADFDHLADEFGVEAQDTESRIDLVRMAGFDGWIIPNNYPDGADIMILEPARWLKFLDEEML